jgi:large subunit ribosomal protein L6
VIPAGVQVTRDGMAIKVKGPKGEMSFSPGHGVEVEVGPKEVVVTQAGGGKQALALHGTTRAVIANMVNGVTTGFSKSLEIVGTGYRAQLAGKKLTLQLGYSHPIEFDPPAGITIALESPTKLSVNGFDKQLVGQVAADIRDFRPPEPYKGKGIKYAGEYIRRKAGKAAGGKSA